MIKRITILAIAFAFLSVACVSGGATADGQTQTQHTKTEVSATVRCPIPRAPGVSPDVSQAATYLVAPGIESISDCDTGELGPICTTVIMTQITCTWEDLVLGDQEVTQSLWHGQGYREGDIAVAEQGYDSGLLASGDRYLSRWSEFQLPDKTIAIWNLVFGTGKLAGISGQLVIECPPAEGASIETCSAQGWYSLPEAD